jgi:hypothetical protein
MSTKTAFKRIALVTVAALGFGVLSSVAPASAVVNNPVFAVDYAASTIELGQDAVLVLHQDFFGDTAAQVVMTFTVTQNVYGADTTTASTNTAMPKVYLGSTTGTVSTGTDAQVARGYAAAAVYSGFPAADIANAKVNINNTQTGGNTSGTAVVSSVANTAPDTSNGVPVRVRGFQRVEWTPTVAGTYSVTVSATTGVGTVVNTSGVATTAGTQVAHTAGAYVWTIKVNAAGTAATATAKAKLALQTASATWSKSINGYNGCNAVGTGTLSTCAVGSTYERAFGTYPVISTTAADEAVYFPKNLDTASKAITAAAIVGNVNSATSTGNLLDPMKGATLYAEVSGPGWLNLCEYGKCAGTASENYSAGRATKITLSETGYTFQLLVGTDGTAGKATITISAANSISATPVVIATETVTFFDTPAKASLTQLAYSINGDAGAAATSVATLAVTDKDGNTIPYAHFSNLGYYATAASANTTVLPAQTALTSKTLSLQPKGALYGTSDVTVTVQNDAGATAASIVAATAVPTGFSDAAKLVPTVKFATTAQSVIVAKNQIATLTVTPSDAGAFAPGAKGTLTFVAKDVNALAVPDSLTATVKSVSTVATSIATQNGSVITDFNSLATLGTWGLSSATGLDAAGTMTLTLYAPVVEGKFTLSMLLGGSAAVAGTASAGFASTMAGTTASLELTVTKSAATKAADAASEVAQAALDAAAEATDAANAATDAGNAAAEAADAATAAAQDAADAVAALSTQVSEMISALKKQITALTNLVIKIQKKVKA